MIAFVTGTLIDKSPSRILIDVHGVGLELNIPTSTYDHLPAVDRPVKMLTYHYVREDTMQLFGFSSSAEKRLFEVMLSVSGVGPRLALAALSALSPRELQAAVIASDTTLLTRIPGVGRKTAERLLIELRDKIKDLDIPQATPSATGDTVSVRLDALAALESLGLSRATAEDRVRQVLATSPDLVSAEQLIRLALKERS